VALAFRFTEGGRRAIRQTSNNIAELKHRPLRIALTQTNALVRQDCKCHRTTGVVSGLRVMAIQGQR
jgi:hypothetical protein